MTWLYLKVYCSESTADRLLVDVIQPTVTSLMATAARWFFIRYVDPDPHLRLRVLIPDERTADVEGAIRKALAADLASGFVWRIVRDTYEPEVDRYGPSTMAVSESLFHHDSELVTEAVRLVRASGDEHTRWRFALAAIDRRLTDFGYSPAPRLALIDRAANSLLRELSDPKAARRRIDARARALREHLESPLDAEMLAAIERHALASASDRNEILARHRDGTLDLPLDDLLTSHLHMFCNRLFVTRQRLHELVTYLFLSRAIRSAMARR